MPAEADPIDHLHDSGGPAREDVRLDWALFMRRGHKLLDRFGYLFTKIEK